MFGAQSTPGHRQGQQQAAIAFFTTLGMALEGKMPVEGPWVDRLCGFEGVEVDIATMLTPDGHGRVELTKFHNPKLVAAEPAIAPPNTLGIRQIIRLFGT